MDIKKKLNLLIVEDSQDDALLLLHMFSRNGYEVRYKRVETVHALEASILEDKWDLIISDYVIPGFSGLEALSILKKCGVDIPFIIVSGAIGEETAVNAMRMGVHDYIMKENLPRLIPAVERELKEVKARQHHRKVELTLRQIEERKAIILEAAFDPIISVDSEGLIIECNPAAERTFGYSRKEVMGKKMMELLVPENLREKQSKLLSFTDEEERNQSTLYKRVEVFAQCSNGNLLEVELTWVRVYTEDVRTYIGFFRDITEKKKVDAERERMLERERAALEMALKVAKLKDDFVANMSHEIRTPLSGIIGMAELLLDTQLNGEQSRFIKAIQESGRTLLSIVNDILDFSKIESGKMVIEAFEFSVRSVVESQAELLTAEARRRDLALMSFVAPDVPEIVIGDAGRFGQIVLNLIGNALKFTEKGKITVRVTREPTTSTSGVFTTPRVNIRCSVTDTGIGLSEASRKQLFQPFTQADGSMTRKYGGTGLGLSICKRLVGLMGGQIGLESKEGQGSTFWFTIPFECPAEEGMSRPKASLSQEKLSQENLNTMRILIVDDDDEVREIVESYAAACGARTQGAETVAKALSVLKSGVSEGDPFHVAIIDQQISDRDGLSLAREIQQDPSIRSTRLILSTAFFTNALGDEAKAAGFSAQLIKPFKKEQLLKCILDTKTPQNQVIEALPPSEKKSEKNNKEKTILIAEDHKVNQVIVKAQVDKLGFSSHIVNNGREALEAFLHGTYDLIILDCQMPVMDGFQAAREIRKGEQEAHRNHIPIVALTAHAKLEEKEKCLASGMDDYISKPASLKQLDEMIKKWI